MRISSLAVDGFGVWSGLELADLAGELIVFYGPNEAGKTTLVEFVRSMFFGFSAQRRAQYLPPLRGGRAGGVIHIAAGTKHFAVTRHADDASALGDSFVTEDGRPIEQASVWSAALGGVDEAVFNNVFVFGLREIQELGTLTDTQAAEELYNLSLGLERVSLVDVLAELDASRNRLLGADDRPSLVTQLLGQRERLQGEIEGLRQSTARYVSLAAQRERLASDVNRLEAEAASLDQQARELALARGLVERWQRRAAIDDRLRLLVNLDTLPPDALARFERNDSRLRAARRRLARVKNARRALRKQIEELSINESLCRQAPRLEALAEQQPWIAALEADVARLEGEITALETTRQESRQRFGIAEPAGSPGAEPISSRALEQLRSTAESLRQARRQMRELRASAASAAEAAGGLGSKLGTALGSGGQADLTPALAEAGELVSKLRQRVQLDQRLDQMSRRQAQLDEQSHEHFDNQLLPVWVLGALGSLFVLGCGLVLLFMASLVLPIAFDGALGWPVGLIGVLAAAAAAAAKFSLERAAGRQLSGCHAQLELLTKQIEEAKAERDALDKELPQGGGALVSRLQTAEKELARLEELMPLASKREAAEREADAASKQALDRRANFRRLQTEWREQLAEHGLPADLRPAQLPPYCRRRKQLRVLESSIAEKREELGRLKAQHEGLTRRIALVVGDVGATSPDAKPLDQLRSLLTEFAEQQTRLKRRDDLERQMDRHGRRVARWSQRIDHLRHRRLRLLRWAGTSDPDEFRRKAAAQAEAGELRAQRAALAAEIEATLAGQVSEDKVAQLLAAPPSLEAAELRVAQARQAVAGQMNQALVTRGEINQQLKTLVEDRGLAHKRLELGIVEKRLQDALDRWRVLSACRQMLDSVRDYYEREHQPQALREASGYLARMTGGRYTRVWTPLGQHALRVDDAQGKSLGVDVLSRGTREQLFLALRLALASAYARRGAQLPLVLDDVFVNFDLARTKAAAAVLRDFARDGHQIVIFTCHEHIGRLFKQIKADVRQLPDCGQLAAAPTEQAPRRARRVRANVVAEHSPEEVPEIDEPPVEPADRSPVSAEIPPPLVESPRQPPSPRSTPEPRYERSQWSAEEFAGELSDRVRHESSPTDRAGDSTLPRSSGDDDAEAA